MSMVLNGNEEFFLYLLRSFDFLRQNGYLIKDFAPYGIIHYLRYENRKIKRRVYIEWESLSYMSIKISKMSLFGGSEFELTDIYQYFDRKKTILDSSSLDDYTPDIIELKVKFIKQYLMPIIKGEIWINELINKRQSLLLNHTLKM
ncbi:MAG: hypothetical protein IKO33_00805 [Bacteroidaceae bacterium]|nr:hypothetical protein [Bacteroidaceae bacterium]